MGVEFVTPGRRICGLNHFPDTCGRGLNQKLRVNWLRPESPVHYNSSMRSIHGIYFFLYLFDSDSYIFVVVVAAVDQIDKTFAATAPLLIVHKINKSELFGC